MTTDKTGWDLGMLVVMSYCGGTEENHKNLSQDSQYCEKVKTNTGEVTSNATIFIQSVT